MFFQPKRRSRRLFKKHFSLFFCQYKTLVLIKQWTESLKQLSVGKASVSLDALFLFLNGLLLYAAQWTKPPANCAGRLRKKIRARFPSFLSENMPGVCHLFVSLLLDLCQHAKLFCDVKIAAKDVDSLLAKDTEELSFGVFCHDLSDLIL